MCLRARKKKKNSEYSRALRASAIESWQFCSYPRIKWCGRSSHCKSFSQTVDAHFELVPRLLLSFFLFFLYYLSSLLFLRVLWFSLCTFLSHSSFFQRNSIRIADARVVLWYVKLSIDLPVVHRHLIKLGKKKVSSIFYMQYKCISHLIWMMLKMQGRRYLFKLTGNEREIDTELTRSSHFP